MKQQLWRRVMERYAERYLERQIPFRTNGEPDAGVLAGALETDFRFWQQHPEYLRLELWAALEGANPLQEAQAKLYMPFIGLVGDLQQRGIVRADVHPMHLITLAASAVTFWFQKRAEICAAVGADPTSSVADDNYLSDVIKILFSGGATLGPSTHAPSTSASSGRQH
jgi:hypothetical protein